MAGRWQQRAVVNLTASTGWTHQITSPKRQYLLVWDGLLSGAGEFDALSMRLNGLSTTIYRTGLANSKAAGWSLQDLNTITHMYLAQGGDSRHIQGQARLTRDSARYVLNSYCVAAPTGGGEGWNQHFYSQATLVSALTSIEVAANITNALGRFTGQVALWSSDD